MSLAVAARLKLKTPQADPGALRKDDERSRDEAGDGTAWSRLSWSEKIEGLFLIIAAEIYVLLWSLGG